MSRKTQIGIVVLVILVAGLAAGLIAAFSGGGSPHAATQAQTVTVGGGGARTTHAQTITTPGAQVSHAHYVKLWNTTDVGAPMRAVLARWPAPYQVYLDSSSNKCYEWLDRSGPNLHPYLYSLCFKGGVVLTKDET